MRERHGKPSPLVIIISSARLSCPRSLLPPPGGGGLFEARRQERAGERGSGEKMKRRSIVLVRCVELVKTVRRKKRRSLVSSIVPPAVSSFVSLSFRFRLTFLPSRFRACLVSFFPCSSHCSHVSIVLPILSRFAPPACACYLVGYRLALSDEERERTRRKRRDAPARRENETRWHI